MKVTLVRDFNADDMLDSHADTTIVPGFVVPGCHAIVEVYGSDWGVPLKTLHIGSAEAIVLSGEDAGDFNNHRPEAGVTLCGKWFVDLNRFTTRRVGETVSICNKCVKAAREIKP